MNVVYEAVEFPRANLVLRITNGDRHAAVVVSDNSITIGEAQQEADRRNMGAWLAEKPGGGDPMVWGDDWEGRLLAILDRPYELELRAAA